MTDQADAWTDRSLSDRELCDAFQAATEAGDMAEYDGLAKEIVRRFTEYVAEGRIPQDDSMIRTIDTQENPHIEIDNDGDAFTSINIEGVRSTDGRPVVIDFIDGEPHLHVYHPNDKSPAVTIRFPMATNDIEFPEVVNNG